MQIDFTQIIIAILGIIGTVLAGLITKYVIPWLKQKNLEGIAQKLVKLAYSIFEENQGDKKFNYVVEQINKTYGKWFDTNEIVAAVQAAYVDFCTELGKQPSPAASSATDTIKSTTEFSEDIITKENEPDVQESDTITPDVAK